MLSMACTKTSCGSVADLLGDDVHRLDRRSVAPSYFLPSSITLLMSFVASIDPKRGSALRRASVDLGVERTADDLVAHTGEVADTTTTHEHDRVLLQVVALAGDVGGDLDARVQTDTSDLAKRRVRLLRTC
jgi:hypothetical protein